VNRATYRNRSVHSHTPEVVTYVLGTRVTHLSGSNTQQIGGEGGIRTHDTVTRTSVFETDAFSHSATSPCFLAGCVIARKDLSLT
jgi:hypothetical protein